MASRLAAICRPLITLALLGPTVPPVSADQEAEPPLIPREALFAPVERDTVRISPDGAYIAHLAYDAGPPRVVVAPTAHPDDSRALAGFDGGVESYRWSYKAGTMLIEAPAADGGGTHVFVAEIESGESKNLTPFEGVSARIESLSPKEPESVVLGLNRRNRRMHDLVRFDLRSGEQAIVFRNDGFAEVFLDGAFEPRAASRLLPDGSTELLARDRATWQRIGLVGPGDLLTTRVLGVTADGSDLIMLDSRGRDTAGLASINLNTRSTRFLAAEIDADVDQVLIDARTGEARAASATYATQRWQVMEDSKVAPIRHLEGALGGDFEIVSRSLDDGAWVIRHERLRAPAEYLVFRPESRTLTPLFAERAFDHAHRVAPARWVRITGEHGGDLLCYYSLPVTSDDGGSPGDPVPFVVVVHSGPWARDHAAFDPVRAWLNDRGYGVLQVNYRGSLGFGRDHIDAADRRWADSVHADVLAAVHWAIDERLADRRRIAIMGKGFGGYAALVGVTFSPYRFAAGASIGAPIDLVRLARSAADAPAPVRGLFEQRLGPAETRAELRRLRDQSPLAFAHRLDAPVLVASASDDPMTPWSEVERFADRATMRDGRVTIARYEGSGESIPNREQRLHLLGEIEELFASVLGGRREPIDERLARSSGLLIRSAPEAGVATASAPAD